MTEIKLDIELKVNDVYYFRYNEEYTKKLFEPYHCFDGNLVVTKMSNDELLLVDTYWGSGGSNKTFSLEEALTKGTLTLICNLEDYDSTQDWQEQYYDDADFIVLRIHAGYRNRYLVKKCAKRSQAKMLESIKQKIEEAESKKRLAEWAIERHTETLKKIEAGDTTVYL